VLLQRTSNDRLGAGFVWSQPSASTKTVYHQSEYAFEAVYAMQLTPTLKLEPDWQVIWNPINNPNAGPAMVFQLQLALAW
jgi:carbohydrate-selective porin OprB